MTLQTGLKTKEKYALLLICSMLFSACKDATCVPLSEIYRTTDLTAPVTSVSSLGGTCDTSLTVGLTTNEPSVIYFTQDGTDPTTSSSTSPSQLYITSDTTLKYFAEDFSGNTEVIQSAFCIDNDVFTQAELEDSFSIIVMPDTQNYSRYYPNIFLSQTQWTIDNIKQKNIMQVLHEGDIVDIQNANDQECMYKNASQAMSKLDGIIPYSIAIGNHDYDDYDFFNKDSDLFNYYFSTSKFMDLESFGGTFEENKMDNSYSFFKGAGLKWMVISLECDPKQGVPAWANSLASSYPDHKIIILIHAYLLDNGNPSHLWETLVSQNENIFFVFSGHYGDEKENSRNFASNIGGKPVYQFMTNFQFLEDNGGNGYLRIVQINKSDGKISISTYSPYLDEYKTDPENQYDITGVEY